MHALPIRHPEFGDEKATSFCVSPLPLQPKLQRQNGRGAFGALPTRLKPKLQQQKCGEIIHMHRQTSANRIAAEQNGNGAFLFAANNPLICAANGSTQAKPISLPTDALPFATAAITLQTRGDVGLSFVVKRRSPDKIFINCICVLTKTAALTIL